MRRPPSWCSCIPSAASRWKKRASISAYHGPPRIDNGPSLAPGCAVKWEKIPKKIETIPIGKRLSCEKTFSRRTTMPVDLNQAKSLFLAVLEMPAHERAAFLTAQCGDDHSLRKRVESMLQAH